MTRFTQKFSPSVFTAAIRNVTLALTLVVFGASAAYAQTLAYVTNSNGGTVSVLDTSTNTVTATNQLSSFINQVQGFINSGALTQAQGQSLINAANSIKTSLGC